MLKAHIINAASEPHVTHGSRHFDRLPLFTSHDSSTSWPILKGQIHSDNSPPRKSAASPIYSMINPGWKEFIQSMWGGGSLLSCSQLGHDPPPEWLGIPLYPLSPAWSPPAWVSASLTCKQTQSTLTPPPRSLTHSPLLCHLPRREGIHWGLIHLGPLTPCGDRCSRGPVELRRGEQRRGPASPSPSTRDPQHVRTSSAGRAPRLVEVFILEANQRRGLKGEVGGGDFCSHTHFKLPHPNILLGANLVKENPSPAKWGQECRVSSSILSWKPYPGLTPHQAFLTPAINTRGSSAPKNK